MAMITGSTPTWETEQDGLSFAREVLRIEADALDRVRKRLDSTIARAADRIFRCQGSVIVTGMGKAGLVGQKLAATLASTGTRAFHLHPAEAVHGDLAVEFWVTSPSRVPDPSVINGLITQQMGRL